MSWIVSTREPGRDRSGCRQIDSNQAQAMLRDQDALVIDVREPHEFEAGRIPDARLIPLRQIGTQVENLRQHGERPIILSCRSGSRSEMACRFLREHGLENVYNLMGGVNAWRSANLSLTQ